VLLVRQLRIPAHLNGDGPTLTEVCAGMVEEGDDPAETVCKEAEQEMGYRLRGLRKVFELYPAVFTLGRIDAVSGDVR
jgi:8-oxo-dGTP pyrophosphatase MutT (NUDIX family)